MSDKPRTFPLPLSSVTDKAPKKQTVFSPVATPQTATRNAAHNAAYNTPPATPRPAQPTPVPARQHAERMAPPAAAPRPHALVSDAVRRAMVTRVSKQGVHDPVVLAALDTVPRHMFMEEGLAAQAYIDASLPIGHQQTISQPYIVARMIEVMRNGAKLARVLEIGTGCGYQAAVLACVSQEVY